MKANQKFQTLASQALKDTMSCACTSGVSPVARS